MKKNIFPLIALFAILAVIPTACAPATSPVPPAATLRPSDTPEPPVTASTAILELPILTPIALEDGKGTGDDKSEVEITFICNEGFLFTSSKGEKILVDALLAGLPQTGMLSPEQHTQMENASPPFDKIDLILITHDDPDHYDFELIYKHMQNDPQTILVATEKAASVLKELFPGRVQAVRVDEWKRQPFTLNGIELEVLGLRHSNSAYDYTHVGFLFTIGGWRILHTGDFDNTFALPSDLGVIDVAFIVNWAPLPPEARHVIKMHWELPSPYTTMQTWTLK